MLCESRDHAEAGKTRRWLWALSRQCKSRARRALSGQCKPRARRALSRQCKPRARRADVRNIVPPSGTKACALRPPSHLYVSGTLSVNNVNCFKVVVILQWVDLIWWTAKVLCSETLKPSEAARNRRLWPFTQSTSNSELMMSSRLLRKMLGIHTTELQGSS